MKGENTLFEVCPWKKVLPEGPVGLFSFTLILQSQQSIGCANALIWHCEAEGWGEEWNGIEPDSCVWWFVSSWTKSFLFFHVLDALTPHGLNLFTWISLVQTLFSFLLYCKKPQISLWRMWACQSSNTHLCWCFQNSLSEPPECVTRRFFFLFSSAEQL